jgi:dihydrofolate reductase
MMTTISDVLISTAPIALIVAVGVNNEIGHDNKLLWHLPDDFKWFRKNTIGSPVIMGRKTFQSIGKPLPGRLNIVLSQFSHVPLDENTYNASSLEDAVAYANQQNPERIFIIGGDSVYRQAIEFSDELYLTRVHGSFCADAYFPPLDPEKWMLTYSLFHPLDKQHKYPFEFQCYIRKDK